MKDRLSLAWEPKGEIGGMSTSNNEIIPWIAGKGRGGSAKGRLGHPHRREDRGRGRPSWKPWAPGGAATQSGGCPRGGRRCPSPPGCASWRREAGAPAHRERRKSRVIGQDSDVISSVPEKNCIGFNPPPQEREKRIDFNSSLKGGGCKGSSMPTTSRLRFTAAGGWGTCTS